MIRILIADDHQMFREGLMALLNSEDNINVIGEASNGKEALLLLETQVPDVLLLDLEMPEIDGFDVLKALKKLNLETKVLVLTMHKSPEFIKNIIKAGAHGFLQKDSGKEILIHAIRQVHSKGTYYTPEVATIVLNSFKEDALSKSISAREKEVIQLIVDGNTTKEIADILFLSKNTIESHRQNILSKLQLKNSAELVRYAIKKGWG